MTREGLGRGWRLTRAADLNAVLRDGRRRRTPRLDISWRANDLGHPRLGVVVPRYGNSAVARNRVRRRVREIARRGVVREIADFDVVIRSRRPAYGASIESLREDLRAWVRSVAS